jgi:hypothetical protein
MLSEVQALWMYLRARYMSEGYRGEEGSVVEKVILTAIFAALALAIGAIIVAKITSKANSIDLN